MKSNKPKTNPNKNPKHETMPKNPKRNSKSIMPTKYDLKDYQMNLRKYWKRNPIELC